MYNIAVNLLAVRLHKHISMRIDQGVGGIVSMNRVKNILIAGILSICMVAVSLPVELLAQEPESDMEESSSELQEQASEKEQEELQVQTQYRIVSFEKLFDEIREQKVALGTPLDELELPDILTASCRYLPEDSGNPEKERPEDGKTQPEENPDGESGEAQPEENPDGESNETQPEENPDGESGETQPEGNLDGESGETQPEENPDGENGEAQPERNPDTENSETQPERNPDAENSETQPEENPDMGSDEMQPDAETESVIGKTGEDKLKEFSEDYKSTDAAHTKIKQESAVVHLKEYHALPEYINTIETLSHNDTELLSENMIEETVVDSEIEETEFVTIEGIIWMSSPEYDSETEGSYIFTPRLPDEYVLEEGVELPEINVVVSATEEILLLDEAAEPDCSAETELACGTIGTDTTWDGGTLTEGTLVIESGVTLRITDVIIIEGNITIEGGGKILREKSGAYFQVNPGSALTLSNITVDGDFLDSSFPMIRISNADVILNEGCIIQNCDTNRGGAIYLSADSNVTIDNAAIRNCSAMYGGAIASMGTGNGSITLNNATIENCSARAGGGAISSTIDVTVRGGNYTNNSTKFDTNIDDDIGGGFICISGAVLSVYGGNFIGNTAANKGGCIYQCGSAGTAVYLYGGCFRENKCSYGIYSGSGAIYNSIAGIGSAGLHLSGNVEFGADDGVGSGTDGIYLDSQNDVYQKIFIDGILGYPVTLYGKADVDRVIAEGGNGHVLLNSHDMKKINFINIGDNGGGWYPVLDKSENNVKLSITQPDADKYFVYYFSNGAIGAVADSNNNNEGYVSGDTIIVQSGNGLSMEGCAFQCWNTQADGNGVSYNAGAELTIADDITLYAIFTDNAEKYYVEYYKQVSMDGVYEKVEADAQEFVGIIGETVTAEPKDYPGFRENTSHSLRVASGVIKKGENLVLRLYYDMNYYTISFGLNDGSGAILDTQTLFSGERLERIIPARAGYSFEDWYKDEKGTDGSQWDFDAAVEDNITGFSATLYAKWVDDIAPILEPALYNEGYKDFSGWIVRKKDLVISVPITEEGSGVKRVDYTLMPENGEPVKGEVKIEDAYAPRQVQQAGEMRLDNKSGQFVAKITVSSDYKGTVSLECIDNAGNSSTERILTVSDGGIIVEDNAPEINFMVNKENGGRVSVKVSVTDDVDEGGNSHVTGGIARITYRLDDKEQQNVATGVFEDYMLPSYNFTVDISGAGEHSLSVMAVDNAGNESQGETKVSIAGKKSGHAISAAKAVSTKTVNNGNDSSNDDGNNYYQERKTGAFMPVVQVDVTDVPKDAEPDTGDTSVQVEVYATVAMIAGMFYLLLYFSTGQNGMTEEEKNEFVSRLLGWAKRGSKCRKYIALAAIFWVLFYYHSIGKRVNVEWKEVYGK